MFKSPKATKSVRSHIRTSLLRDAVLVLSTALLTLLYISPGDVPRSAPSHAVPNSLKSSRRKLLSESYLTPILRTEQDNPSRANIAYFVQVADSTAGHLPRLLRRLHHPQNVYAIHFDKKMDEGFVQSVKDSIMNGNPEFAKNVHFMPSELITYRGISMVLNTINAMKLLLEKDQSWHYFINLSGSDYPLVKPDKIRELLGRHVSNNFNFVSLAPQDKWASNRYYRVNPFYTDEALGFGEESSRVFQSGGENPLATRMNFEYVNSEAWMINSREFCRFVVTDGYARKMLLAFAYSVEASEHYFATLLWNHPDFNATMVPRALRHIVWRHGERRAGQHPFLIDEVQEDGSFTFKEVVETSPNLFIRKFKNPNSPLMDLIDSRMEHPDRIAAVDRLYKWVTGLAIREASAKQSAR